VRLRPNRGIPRGLAGDVTPHKSVISVDYDALPLACKTKNARRKNATLLVGRREIIRARICRG
jgi:hypothetical protein